jgi:hypothetical protein
MPLPLPLLPRLPLVKAGRNVLPLPLQRLLVALALVALALVTLTARSLSRSFTTNARLVSAVILARLGLAMNSSHSANISEFDMDFKKLNKLALTTFKRNWYNTPKGWAKKEFKPQGCRKSFSFLRPLYRPSIVADDDPAEPTKQC